MIYQDFALCGNLSISDNVFLGRWETRPLLGGLVSVVDERKMREHAEGMMNLLKIDISSPRALAEALSGGQRQGVAIARAVGFNAKVIIMDEPTASISVKAISELLELTRDLKRQGISFVIISHRLQDIFAVADRVMVLKTGRCVSVKDVRETNLDETIQLIVRGKSARN